MTQRLVLEPVRPQHADDNARAIDVYEKVGLRKAGALRKASRSHLNREGEDALLMELVT